MIFQTNRKIVFNKRNEYKSRYEESLSNMDKGFSKMNYEMFAFLLEINCSNNYRLSFRYPDNSNQFNYKMKPLKNRSQYIMYFYLFI